jgi:hypothetical protein
MTYESPSTTPRRALPENAAPEGWGALAPEVRAALAPTPALRDVRFDVSASVLEALALEGALGPPLRDALTPARACEVSDAVLAALPSDDDAAFGALLRDTLTPTAAVDLADDVLAAIDLEADTTLGDALRAANAAARHAVRRTADPHATVDLFDAIDAELHRAEPDGWDAASLRAALAPAGAAPDVSAAVLAALTDTTGRPVLRVVQGAPATAAALPPRASAPSRARAWVLVAAAAAAALVLWQPGAGAPDATPEAVVAVAALDDARPLAAVNDARVEELSTGATVTAQVMQFEDGGPTIIMVEEL